MNSCKIGCPKLGRKAHLKALNSIILAIFILCGQSFKAPAPAGASDRPLKVGFIMVGPVADLGWNYAHDQGRKFLEGSLKGKVKTTFAENIPESGEVERVMEKMIAQGNRLIFATSYGYLEPGLRVAARHPEVIIMQCQRSTPPSAKNFGTYFANQYDPTYIVGVMAGRLTRTNKLGYVGGYPVPAVLSCLNAFTLGARSVNQKVKVQVVWINSWSDPPTEAEATKGLIESGVDVVASQLSSGVTTAQTAEKNGALSVGCNAELASLAPKGWISGNCWNWGPLYVKLAQEVMDHSWKPGDRMYSMKDGYVGLSSFGTVVSPKLRKEALTLKQQIENGKVIIFKGPLKDRDGKERVKAGDVADAKALREMNWVVDGVSGSLPKK
jgi:basic membrane protein A and related proteins